MVLELNNIIKLIEEHFQNCVWCSRPPVKELDFQLLLLSQKIIDFRNRLDEVEDVDYSISEIMSYMESTFSIPMVNIDDWIQQNRIRRQLIIDIYNKLSNLRSI